MKSNSAIFDSELNLNPTDSSTAPESQDDPEEEDTVEETTNEKSTQKNREESLPHEQPRMSDQEEYSQHGSTSTIPEVDMNVHPTMRPSSGLRWNVALERRDTGDHGKKKRHKKKKRHIYESATEIPPADSNSIIILGGLIGGVFTLLVVLSCFIQLW